jgi:hypothetical protein
MQTRSMARPIDRRLVAHKLAIPNENFGVGLGNCGAKQPLNETLTVIVGAGHAK